MIDRDIHLARALLIESNAMMRSVAADQLRSAGVGHIAQTSRVKEARLLIEREPFDIIICNREFEGSEDSGQDLLDELLRENQLPHSTVFLMVTSQASFHQVVEAAEAALDGILVRPYTAALLSQRLGDARHRKRELGDILKALDRGEPEVALARALKRYQERLPYATYCGRLVAELFLRLDRPKDARLVFERLAQPSNASWARLGQARACLALGDVAAAKQLIVAVQTAEPSNADAHDLMGRILVEQCDFDGALQSYREAAAITPGCLLRNQHAGALAFYQGQRVEALKLLERSLGLGVQSKLFDALTLLLIAVLRHDAGDRTGVASMREQLIRYSERFPQSRRLARLVHAAEVLVLAVNTQTQQALDSLFRLSEQARDDDFDLEAANTLLLLWARLPLDLSGQAAYASVTEQLGMRFCTSKAITEVLLASARREESATALIRQCHAQVAALSEQAMELSLRGEVEQAVDLLLDNGERCRNAKWLEMAGLIARRNRDRWPGAEAAAERAARLLARSCAATNHIAGIQRSGRSPGGLQLRGKEAGPVGVETA